MNRKKLVSLITFATLSACLGFVSMKANAEPVLVMDNEGGGKITLTDEREGCIPTMRIVYAYTSDGTALFGCWGLSGENVIATYTNGTVRVYPIENFTVVKRKYANQSPNKRDISKRKAM